jgi:hypothetical protein
LLRGSPAYFGGLDRIVASLPAQKDSTIMSDLNRGIMKFDGADSPKALVLSATLVLGSIAVLILWALKSAYTFG